MASLVAAAKGSMFALTIAATGCDALFLAEGRGNEQHFKVHERIDGGAIRRQYRAGGRFDVATRTTGTAQGFDASDALMYAKQYIGAKGGLPSDAALTYRGSLTDIPAQYTGIEGAPYPNNLEYLFIWRHATSSVKRKDKITVVVDDAGGLTLYTKNVYGWDRRCLCFDWHDEFYYAQPWVPEFHVASYLRVWTAAASRKTVRRQD